MTTEIKVPALGESVTEATVAQWHKQEGDAVAVDEALCELETDKVSLEVNATAAGVISEIVAKEGEDVEVGAVLCLIDEDGKAAAKSPAPKEEEKPKQEKAEAKQEEKEKEAAPAPSPAPAPAPSPSPAPAAAEAPLSPAVRKLVEENGLDPAQIPASGKDGRLVKGDVLDYLEKNPQTAAPAAADRGPREERVKMTRLRKRIAERLKEAQNTAAMLTTFNEVDMSAVVQMRSRLKETFEQRHETKLGFMSFFVKAAIVALKDLPAVNAEIDGEELVYKNHYDIGVAVSTPQGLVVPVVRDADTKSYAAIETEINDLGKRARDGKLSLDELQGGTFTISNGGIFGSLLSTPILNPPQSAILGMHKIQERPMAVDGEVKIRPMMYLALSYDHRIIDGREAVTFLVRMKECLEDPERMLLDL